MMQITIRADSVVVEGYVNAVERASKPLWSRMGRFIERIAAGAFKRALKRNDDVRLLLNHDQSRDLGGTKDGTLQLEEDPIGLKMRATITDPEVVKIAREGNLIGCSFGFVDKDVEQKRDEDGMPLRYVKDLDLVEVSLLDRTKIPAYDGTLVTVRSEEESIFHGDVCEDIQIREETPEPAPAPEEEPAAEQEEEAPEQRAASEVDRVADELRELIRDMRTKEE